MRNGLDRNKSTFYYATATSVADTDGNYTGDTYSKPIYARAKISAASGEAQRRAFGITEPYSKVINPLPKSFPVAATLHLWVDTMPTLAGDGSTTTLHDYEVVLPGIGTNHNFLAIRKV